MRKIKCPKCGKKVSKRGLHKHIGSKACLADTASTNIVAPSVKKHALFGVSFNNSPNVFWIIADNSAEALRQAIICNNGEDKMEVTVKNNGFIDYIPKIKVPYLLKQSQ